MSGKENLPGDIFEFGVYGGGSTKQLAKFGRRVWAFDTYNGIPEEDFNSNNGDHDHPGKFKCPYKEAEMFKDSPNIVPIKGRFADTLHVVPESIKAILVYMDCDLYHSYKQVLNWLPNHLEHGAVVVVDDYSCCKGARQAIDEWFQKTGLKFETNTQRFIWS